MKNIIRQIVTVFTFICAMFGPLYAQTSLVRQWDSRFGGTDGDYFTCFIQSRDSGYLLGGFSASGAGGNKSQACFGVDDFWIVKTNSNGIYQWDKTFGGNADEQLRSVDQTRDGGFILGGYTASGDTEDVSQPGYGYDDYWIVKTDSLGNKQWDKRFGGTNLNLLNSVKQTADGGYILGGWSTSGIGGCKTQAGRGLADFWIVKTDSLGNQQWDKRFGGTDNDQLTSLQQTSDGGYILGGWSSSGIGGDKSESLWGSFYSDFWIVKTDSLGNKQWDKRYGGNNTDNLSMIRQTSDHGYILFGRSSSGLSGDKTQVSFGQDDFWVLKTDSLGTKQWDKTYGGNDSEDAAGSLEITNDGGYLLSGTSYSPISGMKSENNLGIEQAWILKTDPLGNKEWDKTIFTDGHDEVGFAIQTYDGCYAIANYSDAGIAGYKTQNSQGGEDYWVVKLCDTTSTIPAVNFIASDSALCDKQCIDFYDRSTNHPVSWQWFFPGASPSSSTLRNPLNICYNDTGSFDVTLVTCGTSGCDTLILPAFIHEYPSPVAFIIHSNDTLFASPGISYQWYSSLSGLIPGATGSFYVSIQTDNIYVAITDIAGCQAVSDVIEVTGINSADSGTQNVVSVFPNPADSHFTISMNREICSDFSIRIIDALGRTVKTKEMFTGKYEMEISFVNCSKGFYVAEIINNKSIYRIRILIAGTID